MEKFEFGSLWTHLVDRSRFMHGLIYFGYTIRHLLQQRLRRRQTRLSRLLMLQTISPTSENVVFYSKPYISFYLSLYFAKSKVMTIWHRNFVLVSQLLKLNNSTVHSKHRTQQRRRSELNRSNTGANHSLFQCPTNPRAFPGLKGLGN